VSVEDRTAQYRQHAHQSRELAERAESEPERELFLKMAHHWDALADIFARMPAAARKAR
jgi:hypothetical protein